MNLLATESTEQFLSGGGEMGKLIRTMDWSKTALGPVETWPQSLRTSVSLCLSSTFPILIAWGPETIQIYNDSYRPICGAMHPTSMGMNFRICWESALEVVGDKFTRGQQGEGTYIHDQRMFLQRYGYLEEAFMTFSFAPIRDESGGVGGIFHPITETTDKMLSARRTQVLRELGAAIGNAKSIEDIASETQGKYEEFMFDLPFILFYKYEAAEEKASLIGSAGTASAAQLAVSSVDLSQPTENSWPLEQLLTQKEALTITDLANRFGEFSCEPYPETPHSAVLLPIHISGQESPLGFLVAGVSARRALDQAYLGFYDLLGNTYNTAVSNVYAYEQEQKRAEALAAIDRSKTAFFSNVSHEFRTPLTLMLGPLEDLQAAPSMPAALRESVDSAHRNAIRLLKLVNNLLDYSRVEAGRIQASYQPLNLTELTADLASSFRSIIEKAEMTLEVNCQQITGPTYVDKQMWEKIVLNLLSNAFKYTLRGSIKVNLLQKDQKLVLQVADTGVGIPEKELPHMFERFHRVQNSAGRTHEGTGIGLSLVSELVQLHGGNISVESTKDIGSTFTVEIPLGKAHLPKEQVLETIDIASSADLRGAFLNEAASLLHNSEDKQNENTPKIDEEKSEDAKELKLLVVDDNRDMREYLVRLLSPHYTVFTAENGEQALERVTELKPALVVSDVMMPVMDGKQFLQELRSREEIFSTPVILLSARAGEESKIDGLESGADDYLVKPFSAAELITKIKAQLKISTTRGKTEAHLRGVFMEAPVAIAIYRGPEHIIELANTKMLEYWGRTAEEVVNRSLFNALPELDQQGFREIMDEVYSTGERFISGELAVQLLRYGQMETIYINLTVEPLRDEQSRINGMMAVAADVSAQVNARKALEKVTGTLQLAVDTAGMGIWRAKLETGEIHISENAKQIHGIPDDLVFTYLDAAELIVPEDRERVLSAIEKANQTKGSFDEDYRIKVWGTDQYKWLNTTGKVELDDAGEISGTIGTILDISEQKEDDQRKNDFIAMVSHELKTPLTSMKGYAQLMKLKADKNEDNFTAQTSTKLLDQVGKMSALINGFLNVSRLDSGKIHLQQSIFNLNDLMKEIIEEVSSYGRRGHQFVFEPIDEVLLNADRDKIGTVLTNLLGNAVKYSPADSTIKANCFQSDGNVYFSVSDNGKGIAKDELAKLFDRFFRVDDKENKHISGFGIGLYLSAEIIKRHHGKIWAESELGNGSTFHVSLPIAKEVEIDVLNA